MRPTDKFSVYRNEYAPAILLDCRGVCYYVYEKFSSGGGDKEDPRLARAGRFIRPGRASAASVSMLISLAPLRENVYFCV